MTRMKDQKIVEITTVEKRIDITRVIGTNSQLVKPRKNFNHNWWNIRSWKLITTQEKNIVPRVGDTSNNVRKKDEQYNQ